MELGSTGQRERERERERERGGGGGGGGGGDRRRSDTRGEKTQEAVEKSKKTSFVNF